MISTWTTFRNDKNGHCTHRKHQFPKLLKIIAASLISIAVSSKMEKKYKLKQERKKGKLCLKLI